MDTVIKSDEVSMAQLISETGLCRQAIYRRIWNEELVPLPKPPAFKKRPKTYFHRADVERLLTS